MATARTMSIKELNGKRFFIPSYQRGYRWTKTEILTLEQDLYEYVFRDRDWGNERDY